MPYKGSDLSPAFKTWFRKEKKRITNHLTNLGCTNIQLDYGFYFFSGFFTSKSGQIYYMRSKDVRDVPYDSLLYRTAMHYKDFTGGHNQYCNPDFSNLNIK